MISYAIVISISLWMIIISALFMGANWLLGSIGFFLISVTIFVSVSRQESVKNVSGGNKGLLSLRDFFCHVWHYYLSMACGAGMMVTAFFRGYEQGIVVPVVAFSGLFYLGMIVAGYRQHLVRCLAVYEVDELGGATIDELREGASRSSERIRQRAAELRAKEE